MWTVYSPPLDIETSLRQIFCTAWHSPKASFRSFDGIAKSSTTSHVLSSKGVDFGSLTLWMPRSYIYIQKSWFSNHGRIYMSSRIHFLFYPAVREFLLWSLKGVVFSFLFLRYNHAWRLGKRKKTLSWGRTYTSMVAEDHILGYDKNILWSLTLWMPSTFCLNDYRGISWATAGYFYHTLKYDPQLPWTYMYVLTKAFFFSFTQSFASGCIVKKRKEKTTPFSGHSKNWWRAG